MITCLHVNAQNIYRSIFVGLLVEYLNSVCSTDFSLYVRWFDYIHLVSKIQICMCNAHKTIFDITYWLKSLHQKIWNIFTKRIFDKIWDTYDAISEYITCIKEEKGWILEGLFPLANNERTFDSFCAPVLPVVYHKICTLIYPIEFFWRQFRLIKCNLITSTLW